MYKRLAALVCALAVVLTFALYSDHAQSATTTVLPDLTIQKIWPRASTGNTTDTLSLFLADSTANQFTDSVNVQGARYVLLLAQSSGADTITVAHSVRSPGGTYCAGGIVGCLGTGNVAATAAIANTGPVNGEIHVLWEWNPEIDASGSLHPIHVLTSRWRLRSGDARRYATASSATEAATGSVAVWAYVWR